MIKSSSSLKMARLKNVASFSLFFITPNLISNQSSFIWSCSVKSSQVLQLRISKHTRSKYQLPLYCNLFFYVHMPNNDLPYFTPLFHIYTSLKVFFRDYEQFTSFRLINFYLFQCFYTHHIIPSGRNFMVTKFSEAWPREVMRSNFMILNLELVIRMNLNVSNRKSTNCF